MVIAVARVRKYVKPAQFGPSHGLLALSQAEEFRRLLDSGEVSSQAELARREGLTRARVTQILSLLDLHPKIVEYVRGGGIGLRLYVLRSLATLPAKEQLRLAAERAPDFRRRRRVVVQVGGAGATRS